MRPFIKWMTMVAFTCFFFKGIAQNTCQTAQGLGYPGEPFSINGSTANANDNATSGAVYCNTGVGTGGQIWYAMYWGEDHAQVVTITTEGGITDFDTKLHVYTGYCGSFSCLAGDDDSGAGNTSYLQFAAFPGNYYFIRVGGFLGYTGNFTLSVDAGIGGCTEPAASNYDASATWDDGTCCYGIPATFYFGNNGQDNFAQVELYVDGVLVEYMQAGVQENVCIESGCYVSLSCRPDNDCNRWFANTYNITINGESFSGVIPDPGNYLLYSSIDLGYIGCGCTDPAAINYKESAWNEDGSCIYPQNNGNCVDAILIQPNSSTLVRNGGQPFQPINWPSCGMQWQGLGVWYKFVYQGGNMIIESLRYNQCDPLIGLYDECGGNVLACNDDDPFLDSRLYINCFNGLMVGETYYILAAAWNTNAEYFLKLRVLDIPGCTDPEALNYSSCASIDDNSCLFENNATCEGDLDHNNSINVADLLIFLTLYNTTCNP